MLSQLGMYHAASTPRQLGKRHKLQTRASSVGLHACTNLLPSFGGPGGARKLSSKAMLACCWALFSRDAARYVFRAHVGRRSDIPNAASGTASPQGVHGGSGSPPNARNLLANAGQASTFVFKAFTWTLGWREAWAMCIVHLDLQGLDDRI
jgi:hypothetical protein